VAVIAILVVATKKAFPPGRLQILRQNLGGTVALWLYTRHVGVDSGG
jgi:hypothetical protein